MQEGQGIDELPRVLGGRGFIEPPAGGLLQGLVELGRGVFHHQEEAVRVVEVAVAGHDVRVRDAAVDLHLVPHLVHHAVPLQLLLEQNLCGV